MQPPGRASRHGVTGCSYMQLLWFTCRCFLRFDAERFDAVSVFTAGKQDLDSKVMLAPFADFIKKILSWNFATLKLHSCPTMWPPMTLACSRAGWCDWQTIKKQCNCILPNEWGLSRGSSLCAVSSSLGDVAFNNNNQYCCIYTIRYCIFAHCTAHLLYVFLLCCCYCCTFVLLQIFSCFFVKWLSGWKAKEELCRTETFFS